MNRNQWISHTLNEVHRTHGTYIEGVLLGRGNGENRIYVHEIVAEKEGAAPFWTGTNKGYPGGDTPSVSRILHRILNVKKQIGAEDTVDKTKDASSHHTFPLIQETLKIFKAVKYRETQNRIAFGKEYQENSYVFEWPDGYTYSPDCNSH